jgi:xanthine dehydrogenase accessory factor
MTTILHHLDACLRQKQSCVYCAVIETRGSTPQKAGAAMLVFPDGSQRGTLGGGCVEAEVKQRSLAALQAAANADIVSFSLDDNYGWDDGLICGGRMTMLVAPLHESAQSTALAYYARYLELVNGGRGCTECVILKAKDGVPAGARYVFDHQGKLAASLGPLETATAIIPHLPSLNDRPGPATQQGIAFLPTLPRITLLIVGGGHVGQAVAELAAKVDFQIIVLDDRDAFASAERFPTASERFVGPIGPKLDEIKQAHITRSTYALIVTRGHAHDEEALYHLAGSGAGYVGMIGSRRKIKLIFEDLIAKGIPASALERVHAPLGFDIGSQTVPEIAISIVAELIAARNKGTTEIAARTPIRAENTAK